MAESTSAPSSKRPVSGGATRAASPVATAGGPSLEPKKRNNQNNSAWHDVLDLCKKGFANKLESLTEEILKDVREAVQQAAVTLRTEVSDLLLRREGSLDATLVKLTTKLDQLEQKVLASSTVHPATVPEEGAEPVPMPTGMEVNLRPVMEELRLCDGRQKAAAAEIAQQLEKLCEVSEELQRSGQGTLNRLHCLEQQAQRLEVKTQTVEGKISHVVTLQQTASLEASNLKKDLQAMSEQDLASFAELNRGLQGHAGEIRELALHDEVQSIRQDLGTWKKQSESEFKLVVGEIWRLHQVLHLDFVKVHQDELMRRALHRGGSRHLQAPKHSVSHFHLEDASSPLPFQDAPRFRDFFCQTEPTPQKESHCQTDPNLFLEVPQDALKPRKRHQQQRNSVNKKLEQANTVELGPGEDHLRLAAKEVAMQTPYSVYDYYHETGCCQAIARHHWFENFALFVVFLNACWMAVDVDLNNADILTDAHPAIIAIENSFCGYFFLDVVIRFGAFEEKRFAFQDGWFVIDLILAVMYALDTWVVTLLMVTTGMRLDTGASTMTMFRMMRIVKICRLTRLAKLLRAVPELVIIMKGIGYASRSVAIFFSFWIVISYVFAIGIRQMTDNTEVGLQYFPTVPEAMNTLLLQGLFPESTELISAISGGSSTWYLWPVTVFFLSLVSITVMYMLVGVLVEVVHVVSSVEKDSLAVAYLAHEMRYEMDKLGFPSEEPISKNDFQKLVVEPSIARIVHNIGVDVVTLCDMLDLLFEEVDREGLVGMPFGMLVDGILSLRGSNPARVKDFVEQLKLIKHIVRDSSESLNRKLKREFDSMKIEMQDVKEDLRDMREAEVRERAMRTMQRTPDSSDSLA